MPAKLRITFILLLVALLMGAPWGYALYRASAARCFHVVEEGVLYRSGQLPQSGLARIVHDYKIRTIICLREGDQENDETEEKFCRRWGLNHVRIPPRSWWASNGPAPAEIGLKAFRKVMDNPDNYPVLVHCFAGVHRTGAYCAAYRMDYHGWSNDQALAELKRIGYRTIDGDWDLLTYLENYRPEARTTARPVSRTKNQ